MPSSGLGAVRAVIQQWLLENGFLSSQIRSSGETVGTSRITFWSVCNAAIYYRTDKSLILQEDEELLHPLLLDLLQIDVKETRQDEGKEGRGDLYQL
jgi:hypothetical protein